MTKATSTRKTQPIYRWRRRNQIISNSNSRFPKSRITFCSVNQIGMIPIAAFPRSQSSWRQNPKGRHFSISRSQINQHASCQPAAQSPHQSRHASSQPAAQSPHQFRRLALMTQIFLWRLVSKSSPRHRGNPLPAPLSCFSLADSNKQKSEGASVVVKIWPHKIVTRVQATKSLCHSGVISEAALRPEDTSTRVALMLSTISELSLRRLKLRARHHDNKLSLISAFNYTATTDHPWSSPSVAHPDLSSYS